MSKILKSCYFLLLMAGAAPTGAQELHNGSDTHQNCDNFYENLQRFAVPAPSRPNPAKSASRSAQGAPQSAPPYTELSEGNAGSWGAFATGTDRYDGAPTANVTDSLTNVKVGTKSIRFDTTSGFDSGLTYPKNGAAHLSVDPQGFLTFWAYGVNTNQYGFQGDQPRVVIKCAGGSYSYQPSRQQTLINQWSQITIPLAGNSTWARTQTGNPLLSDILQVELHFDTWDYGFTVYVDGFGFYSYPNTPLPTPTPPAGVDPNVIKPRVLLYVFDPIMENKGGLRQHSAYYGFQDPLTLTPQIVADLRTKSHDRVQYQVVDTKVVDAHPYFADGFQHTDASFDAAWSARDFHESSRFDYPRFVRENNIAARIESGDLDEVWIYAGPISGLYESAMGGDGAYWINGEAPGVVSKRAFVMMGWNFERGVGEAIHSYGHRAESIMVHSYGTWAANQSNSWNKFTLLDSQMLGLGGVGNVHFPVNGQSDYDYANPRNVTSNVDGWASYPAANSAARSINKNEWTPTNSDPQREYLQWWYDKMPHGPGAGPDGFLNNWWRYIADVDQFKSWDGNLNGTISNPIVTISNPANGSTVTGIVNLAANVSTDGAIGRVDFYIDGTYRATDETAPYTYAWNTAGLTGTHQLQARAIELKYGREATSPSIEVSMLGPTAPQSVSVSPNYSTSKNNVARSFTAIYRDANGADDLRDCSILVGTTSSTASAIYAKYNPVTNKVYLRNDADTGWVNPEGSTPGSLPQQTVQNSLGVLNVQNMSVSRTGTDITVKWSISAKDGVIGAQNLYLSCTDASGASDSLRDLGDWTLAAKATSGLIISEFRFRGTTSGDEYVEIYNTQTVPLDIGGWFIRTNTGSASQPSMQSATVPPATIIPARGHFLFSGTDFRLNIYKNYGATVTNGTYPAQPVVYIGGDVADDSGVALYNEAGVQQDAAGFTTSATFPSMLREGAGLLSAPIASGQYAFIRVFEGQLPKDTDDNAADFAFVSNNGIAVAGTDGPISAQLGSPNPESLASPININAQIGVSALDPRFGFNVAPNRIRNGSGNSGNLVFRRILKNNSDQPIRKIRFMITALTTLGAPAIAGQSDVRLSGIGNEVVMVEGTPITVFGSILEFPSAPYNQGQPGGSGSGGGLGASLTFDSMLSTPLLPGESRAYSFKVDVVKTGSFYANINTLALSTEEPPK